MYVSSKSRMLGAPRLPQLRPFASSISVAYLATKKTQINVQDQTFNDPVHTGSRALTSNDGDRKKKKRTKEQKNKRGGCNLLAKHGR